MVRMQIPAGALVDIYATSSATLYIKGGMQEELHHNVNTMQANCTILFSRTTMSLSFPQTMPCRLSFRDNTFKMLLNTSETAIKLRYEHCACRAKDMHTVFLQAVVTRGVTFQLLLRASS